MGKYLPDFPVTGSNVLTLRHCFTHATALDGHEEWGGMHNPWLDNVIANANESLRPGQVHNYSGMGYDLAGKVMEIVSGKSIFRLMREHLFDPLGMTHTTLEEDLGFSCFSTAADMARLGQLLLNRGAYGELVFVSPQTFEQILPQPLSRFYPAITNKDWGVGLTWMRQRHPEAGTNGIAKDATVLSRNVIGHGSATAAILRADQRQLSGFPRAFVSSENQEKHRCYVIAPQCPKSDAWSSFPDRGTGMSPTQFRERCRA